MSTQPRLRGRSPGKDLAELTRLKFFWRDFLPEAQKDYWRARFSSPDSQAVIREELRMKLKFNLRADNQLTAFRRWVEEQDEREAEAQRQIEDERATLDQHPDWTKDQVRDDVLRKAYFRARAQGDFKLGLATAKVDLKEKEVTLDRAKFEFDATREAMAKLDTLKAIKTNSKLTEDQKLKQARLELFGVTPK